VFGEGVDALGKLDVAQGCHRSTFWHWSKESFREGSLLSGPLHGIGSHWDEWYRHEASGGTRKLRAIAA